VNDVAGPTTDERHLATLGRLTRGALHEIANPLLALVGSAEFALSELEPGSKGHGRVATIHSTGLEIAEIVRALQGFTRQRNEPPRRLSLADAAGEAVALVRLVGATPDVEVVVRAEAEPRVHEAPGLVARGLVELLLDALATAERGDVIELAVREDGGDAQAVVAGGAEIRFPRVDA
jgi:signal transduction histidine kinase